MRVAFRLMIALVSLFLVGNVTLAASATPPAQALSKGPAAPHDPSRPDPAWSGCLTDNRIASSFTFPPPPLIPEDYFQNDWRLGPRDIVSRGPLGSLLAGYHRTDGLSPRGFLECYWNYSIQGWWFPNNDGFVLDANGVPVKSTGTLQPGQKVDLFGTGTGHFLAPAGTSYAERALPPSNLNTLDNRFPFGYHLYEVVQPITVEVGPIRPWFGQPGLGLQYRVTQRVSELVAAGALKELN